jgi:hypothetical protein
MIGFDIEWWILVSSSGEPTSAWRGADDELPQVNSTISIMLAITLTR